MKKKLGFFALALVTFFGLVGATLSTISWFVASVITKEYKLDGSSAGAYFAYGDGSSAHPFGISIPRHINNLAWLQYMGKFDDTHYYFELANDINLEGNQYVIPPIGTEDHPFIGVFNGKGHTINNIKVTNDVTAFTNKPSNIAYSADAAEIVGFFGVVGRIDDESYSSATNTLKNVTINNLTVESVTEHTLIGLAAGYVNADMNGVKVGTSSISVNGNSAKSYTSNLSDYGLVGYSTKTASSGTFQQKVSNYYDSSTSGDDAGWGGSIDFKTFYERLDTIRDNYAQTNQSMAFVYDDVYDGITGERLSHTARSGKTQSYGMIYNEDYTKSGVTYNPKIGAVKIKGNATKNNNSSQQDIANTSLYYLNGGHFSVSKTRNYYEHEGYKIYKTVGAVTHYLGADNETIANNVNIADRSGTNESKALVWEIFDGTSGKVSTKYNNTSYYLAIAANGEDLVLRSGSGNGTTFKKATDGYGGIRLYVDSGSSYSYLDYSNGWKMINPPTLTPDHPPAVTAPDPGTEDEYYASHGLNPANYTGAYQITYMDGTTKRFISVDGSTITSSTTPFTNGWNFNGGTNLPTSGQNNTIKVASGNYYIGRNNNNNALTYTNSSTNWTATNSNGNWTFSYSVSSGCGGSTTYYINANGSTLSVSTTSSSFTLETTSSAVSAYNSSLHDEWVAAKELYDGQVAALDEYNNVTRPAEIQEYETLLANHNTAFSNLYLPTVEISSALGNVVSGPDYQDVDRSSGMDYEHDQDVTYLPLAVESNLEAKTTNTGYIIGGETYTSASDSGVNGNGRIASFYTISASLTNYNRTDGAFDEDSVYTVDGSGLHTIDDDNNNYQKYLDSKLKIEDTLNTPNSDKVYGLHFTANGISASNLVTARYAAINGEEHTNYKMPANSIDFNLREQGYVNFFAGTYGYSGSSDTTIDSFFSLHQVQRSGETITAINEIEEIYGDGVNNHSYVFKFANSNTYTTPYSLDPYNSKKFYVLGTKYLITDTSHGGYTDGVYHQISSSEFTTNYSGYTKIFDMNWLKDRSYFNNVNSQAFHKAFYFEIPTNPGEYALGTVTGKSYGAYLIYLDIGANAANQDKITAYAVSTFQSGLSYPVGVDFNISSLTNTVGGETACIIIFADAASDGDVDFTVSGSTVNYESDFDTKYSYSAIPLAGADPPEPADVPPANGTRTIYTRIMSTDGSIWNIVTSEDLDSSGEPLTDPVYVSIKHNDEVLTESDLPDSFSLTAIRKTVKTNIVTITRESGSNTFNATATYGGTDNKEVAVTLDATGLVLVVSDIASGYTITINGTPITTDPQYL